MDPENAQDYRRNAQACIEQLRQLDIEYRQTLSQIPQKHIVMYHPSLAYVAQRYGLEIMAIHDTDASGYGVGRLDEAIRYIRRHDIKVIFAEREFTPEQLQSIADKTGTRIEMLDTLGGPKIPGYDSYLNMMRSNLRLLRQGLKG